MERVVHSEELGQGGWHLHCSTLAGEPLKVGDLEAVPAQGVGGLEMVPDEKGWGPERQRNCAAAERWRGTIALASL